MNCPVKLLCEKIMKMNLEPPLCLFSHFILFNFLTNLSSTPSRHGYIVFTFMLLKLLGGHKKVGNENKKKADFLSSVINAIKCWLALP